MYERDGVYHPHPLSEFTQGRAVRTAYRLTSASTTEERTSSTVKQRERSERESQIHHTLDNDIIWSTDAMDKRCTVRGKVKACCNCGRLTKACYRSILCSVHFCLSHILTIYCSGCERHIPRHRSTRIERKTSSCARWERSRSV